MKQSKGFNGNLKIEPRVGERGGGNLGRGNCGTGVQDCISKPTPFIYLALEKKNK